MDICCTEQLLVCVCVYRFAHSLRRRFGEYIPNYIAPMHCFKLIFEYWCKIPWSTIKQTDEKRPPKVIRAAYGARRIALFIFGPHGINVVLHHPIN